MTVAADRQSDGAQGPTTSLLPVDKAALLESVLDHMDQGLMMIDAAGNVPVYNSRVLEILGLPAEFMATKPTFREIVEHQLAHAEFEHVDRAAGDWLASEGLVFDHHRYTRQRPDGRYIEVRSVPLPGGGAVRTFTDVTEAVKQQEILRVAQTELIAAREKAEAGSRAKSDFLAAMSHEIRTPLNAVLGLATCLLECKLAHEERRMVQTIHDSGDNLLQILNDILDFSKLEACQLTFEDIAFAPDALSANVVSILGVRAVAKGLSLTSSCDQSVPAGLVGDVGRIRQVLLNLVTNAVKFTEAGSVSIALKMLGRKNGSAALEWSVSDTGIGISEEGRAKLFRDFSQADTSINRRFGGSGLGLAICKRIIDQMGGTIGVDSVPGQGSRFWFRLELPIASAISSRPADDQSVQAELQQRLAALGRPLRVLVVDDNATNRLVAGKMLSEFKPVTNFACDGNEAITAVHRFKYDLVLMDMHMPELDGLAATRAIRQAGLTVPVVAFTANAFKEDIDACLAAGMADFISKPVRRKDLLRAVLKNVRWVEQPSVVEAPETSAAVAEVAASTSSTNVPTVDVEMLQELVGEITEEGLAMAAAAFFDDLPAKLAQIASLALDGDRTEISRLAHAVKGAAATIALAELAGAAKAIETSAPTMTSADLAAAIEHLNAAAGRARGALEAHVPSLVSGGPALDFKIAV
jgi:signal transduction histidine kinase/DNA-binding NarL/FixJ family response regulator/HPt (histidine-containing phosphotransfer) domain-containing protein